MLAFNLVWNHEPTADDAEPPSTYRATTSLPLSDVVARVHLEYDRSRAARHDIPLYMATLIRETATQEKIPLGLAFSLVRLESNFIPWAVSHAGAIGLTQVMPPTGREHCGLSPGQLKDPRLNVPCGFSYLRMLHDRHRDWSVALAAYNVGDARRARAHLTGEPDGSWYAQTVLDGAG